MNSKINKKLNIKKLLLKYVKREKRTIWILIYTLGLLLCILFLVNNEEKRIINNEVLEIHVISLGKADSILIRTGNEAMLIDSGLEKTEGDIIKYLKAEGINELKYAVATHGDKDHIGGMKGVLKAFRVKNLLVSPVAVDSGLYNNMIYRAGKRGTKVIVPKLLESYDLGNGKITILAPGEEALNEVNSTGKINNSSLVIRLDFGERSFLFMGDALHTSEQEMINRGYRLKADVIKIGHHGLSDASSKDFIDSVDPKIAIITCGDEYNDENRDTIVDDMLLQKKILTYHTGIDGNIILISDGIDIKVK